MSIVLMGMKEKPLILSRYLHFSGVSYNIWYEKWSGGDREDHTKYHSETRCDIARDSGYTRGDVSSSTFICLLFARGCCPQGSDCTYLHRLPRIEGDGVLAAHGATRNQGNDIFGREKTGDYRDDMGGVGSMQRVNKTLYVGKIHEEEEDLRRVSHGGDANFGGPQWRDGGRTVRGGKSVGQVRREQQHGSAAGAAHTPRIASATEQVLRRHFSEWGPLERVRVLHHRGCAFVTYVSEASAQFAKEAMSNQSLDHGEILNVRWSTEDPNPAAQRRHRQQIEQEGQKRIAECMTDEQREALCARSHLENAEAGEPDPDVSKRLRIEAGDEDAKGAEMDEDELARLIDENQRNWEQIESERNVFKLGIAVPADTASTGFSAASSSLLSPEALGGLAYLQSLKQGSEDALSGGRTSTPCKANGLGSLAAYDSDSSDS